MAITYKTQGLVLRSKPARGADRIYFIYTKDYGKIVAVAKSAKKTTSKLAGHLEPLTLADLHLARGSQLDKIAGSKTVQSYKDLKRDLNKLNHSFYCLELVDKITPFGLSDQRIFSLLIGILEYLEQNQPHQLVDYSFALKILAIQGFGPSLKDKNDLNKVLRFLLIQNYSQVVRLKIENNLWRELQKFIHSYLEYHLEASLQTGKFLL